MNIRLGRQAGTDSHLLKSRSHICDTVASVEWRPAGLSAFLKSGRGLGYKFRICSVFSGRKYTQRGKYEGVDLEGSGARRTELGAPTRHKLFFALYPDAAAAEQAVRIAARIRRRDGLRGQPTPEQRLHISLNGLGAHCARHDQVIAWASEAVSRVRAPPFRLALNQVVSWKGAPRPLVLLGDEGVIGVYALHAAIHRALAEAGLAGPREPSFTPHLTLLRDHLETAVEFVPPVVWTVRDFHLVDSLHGEGRHLYAGTWRLTA